MSGLTIHPASPWFAASAAIADGGVVDWRGLDREATTDEERELLEQLRVVADIAALHRTMDDGPLDAAAARVVGHIAPVARSAYRSTNPRLEPPPGRRWGNYELLEEVGAGAFGEVYRARDLTLDREVAVKLFREHEGVDRSVERMLAEGRTLAQVRHPNVVTVHGAESHDGRSGLCMEFVQGQTLEALVKHQGPMNAREVSVVGQDLCRALAAVHSAGLVHRDVKGRNVMREDGGRIVLMDFGAGQAQRDPDEVTPRLTGTPLYLAPEVLSGREASVQSDVYSLGVLLFFLASGEYPTTGASLAEVRDAHAAGRRRRLADLRPTLPAEFLMAVERALEPNPAARVASAGQLQVLLAKALNHSAGQGLACGRKRYVAVGIAAAAFIGAVFFGRAPITSELASGGAQDIRSLAVLPFANRAPSVEHDYLGTGLADVLNASLAHASSLEVRVPRSGTAGAADSPAAIGRALGVDAVVTGSYEVRGDDLDVTYAVTDVRRDLQLAGNSLPLSLGDLLGARGRLLSELVSLLRGDAAAVRAPVSARPTGQNAALQDFLHAAYETDQFWQRPSAERLQLAERHLLLAVEKDPNFSLALVSLAKLRWLSAFYGYGDGGRELDAAVVAADRALAIDPTLGEAHAARALVDFQRGALDGARARLRMAAAQSPNAALVHYAAGFYFMGRGLAAESIAAFQRAQQLEPDLVRRELGFAYQYAGNLEQAQLQYRDDLTRHPGDLTTMKSLAFVLLGLNRVEDAAPLVAEAERLSAHDRGVRLLAVFLGVRRGTMNAVTPWLQATRADHWNDGGSCANVAAVLAAAGRSDEAVLWLKRAGEVAMRSYPYVAESPYFSALRALPEFGAYAATLEQEWRTLARAEEQDPLLAPRVAQ